MDLEQRLRASLVAPDPGAAFTARVMARLTRHPARRRLGVILLGTVMAMAAAAAVLTWRLPDSPAPPALVAVASPVPKPPAAEASAPLPVPEATESIVPATPSVPVAPVQVARPGTVQRFSVLVRALHADGGDLAGNGPIRALHAALLDELRKVPGISVQEQLERPERDDSATSDYVLQIEAAKITAVRTVAAAGTSGGAADFLRTVVTVSPRGTAGQQFPLQVRTGPMPTHCNDLAGVVVAECRTPPQLAEDVVTAIRLQVFPPDPAFFQQVVAQLEQIDLGQCIDCTTFSAGERSVMELLQRLAFDKGSRLDADTIRAIARYTASQSARMRANVWSTLRWARAAHPALVAPLLDTLHHDPDQQVRLIALAFLEADFSSDPSVRIALDAIIREEADSSVRLAALRVVRGPAQWRDDILLALHDSGLPYESRLAPLLADGLVDVSATQAQHRRDVLREPQVLSALISLVHAHRQQPAHSSATTRVLEKLADIDDPAVSELFLQLIREGALTAETSGEGNRIDLAGPLTTWILRNRDDPRLPPLLAQVAPRLRGMVEGSLPAGDLMGPAQLAPDAIPVGLAERMREVTQQAQPAEPPVQ